MDAKEFFAATGPTEAQRYKLSEVIGKGSYGVVAAASDQFNNGEKVAIKKITNAFENLVDARRTLREMKLLRHLRCAQGWDCHQPQRPQMLTKLLRLPQA